MDSSVIKALELHGRGTEFTTQKHSTLAQMYTQPTGAEIVCRVKKRICENSHQLSFILTGKDKINVS
jgi:hypothetical protein